MLCKTPNPRLLAAALCLSATCAAAADPGFYVSVSPGLGDEDPKSAGTNVGNSLGVFHVDPDSVEVDDGKLAWSVGLGYRINRYISGEVEYIDFGTTNIIEHYSVDNPGLPFPFPTTFDFFIKSHVTGPALSLLGTLPLSANFELYLRGGALFSSREYEVTFGRFNEKLANTVWLAGAGVRWSLAKRWAIRAEYQQTGELSESIVSGETKLKRVSLGVLFSL